MKQLDRRATYGNADLEALEQMLTRSFHPVEIRPDFRSGLHTRLAGAPFPPELNLTIMQYVVLSLGSVAVAALALIAVVQAGRSILSALGYLQETRPGGQNL